MSYLLLLVLCLGVSANEPKRCCFDKQFSVTLAESGSFYRPSSDDFVPLDGYNLLSYDYYGQRTAVESHQSVNGTTTITSIIEDHTIKKKFIISNGVCRVFNISTSIRQPCIPDHATFQGEFKLGYGFTEIDVQVWNYVHTESGASIKLTVSKGTCIPLVESSYTIDSNGVKVELVYVFYNFKPGVSDLNVFKIHPNCPAAGGKIAGVGNRLG